jgi:hypothetical protein
VALSLPLAGLAQEDKPREQSGAEQAQSNKQNTDTHPNATTSFIRLEWGKEKNETDWGKPQCEQPRNHDEADLCEQRRMSKAAEDAVNLNEIQTGIGAVGALLLLATLALTIWGTRAAVKAANAAVKSSEIAERTALHIERPYVFLGDMRAEYTVTQQLNMRNGLSGIMENQRYDGLDAIKFSYVIKNHGRTPGIVYEIFHGLDCIQFSMDGVTHYPPDVPNYDGLGLMVVMEVIGADGVTKEQIRILTPPAECNVGPFGDMPVIFGYIKYRSISGKCYQARFGYTWIGGPFVPYGDEAYNYDKEIEPPPAYPGSAVLST